MSTPNRMSAVTSDQFQFSSLASYQKRLQATQAAQAAAQAAASRPSVYRSFASEGPSNFTQAQSGESSWSWSKIAIGGALAVGVVVGAVYFIKRAE